MIKWLKKLFTKEVTVVKVPKVVVLVRDQGVENPPIWLYCGDSLRVQDTKSNKLVCINFANESPEYKTILIDVEEMGMITRVNQTH